MECVGKLGEIWDFGTQGGVRVRIWGVWRQILGVYCKFELKCVGFDLKVNVWSCCSKDWGPRVCEGDDLDQMGLKRSVSCSGTGFGWWFGELRRDFLSRWRFGVEFPVVWSFVDKGGRGKSVLEEQMLLRFLMELAVWEREREGFGKGIVVLFWRKGERDGLVLDGASVAIKGFSCLLRISSVGSVDLHSVWTSLQFFVQRSTLNLRKWGSHHQALVNSRRKVNKVKNLICFFMGAWPLLICIK